MEIIRLLINKGVKVSYHDPYFKVLPKTRKYGFEMESVGLDDITIASFDSIIIATDHDNINYSEIKENARLIIDTKEDIM